MKTFKLGDKVKIKYNPLRMAGDEIDIAYIFALKKGDICEVIETQDEDGDYKLKREDGEYDYVNEACLELEEEERTIRDIKIGDVVGKNSNMKVIDVEQKGFVYINSDTECYITFEIAERVLEN